MLVIVKPNSKQKKIVKTEEGLVVYLKAPPKKGMANKELIKLLSKYFGKKVTIVSGFASTKKQVKFIE